MIRTVKNLREFGVPWGGNSVFHEELEFFATEDDRVLGVVVRDRIDKDYSWVIIAHQRVAPPQFGNEVTPTGYSLNDQKVSRPTIGIARKELHAAMEKLSQREPT